jgi:1-acyl-sn-glycerol-3-phosphate acyltransferase
MLRMQDRTESIQNEKSQFQLLGLRRFAPFFWTQFLGAFNDNLYKNALMLLIAFKAMQGSVETSNMLINIAAGLFIMPFFLFSSIAGQIADKYEKSTLIRRIKILEIIIMALAALAFIFNSVMFLLLLLFLMGTQSTFFGPVKYSIMPQHLSQGELVGGNAMVEMGTFVAILLGTIAGGFLILTENHAAWISCCICLVAVSGWAVSRLIPEAPAASAQLSVSYNPFKTTWETIGYARRVRSVFLSILGISWFWLLGVAYLTQLPNYTKLVLKCSESVVTLLLTMFSVGIGVGSLLCEKLSGRKIELGLVPLGAIGLSIFGIDLFFAYETPDIEGLMAFGQFINTDGSVRVLVDLLFIGVFGGFYIVPLFALIQKRSEPEYRARVIAANNILNALFMVIANLAAIAFLNLAGLTIPQFFLVLAIANIAVSVYIFSVVPEFVMRFIIWILTHTMYRVIHSNLERIPDEGPAVLVCNHVSYVDALIIGGACRRPIRFVMLEGIYRMPVIHFVCRTSKAIPITSQKKDPVIYDRAFEEISGNLDEGELVCIFPEGRLTPDGNINAFRSGIEKIIKRNPVPVYPMALRGLWGSFFSHKSGEAMTRWPKRFWSKVELVVGKPVMPENATARGLQKAVLELRGEVK